MASSIRKKSSNVFSQPTYIKKKSTIESKVEKIINDTIKEKIFNLLDINKTVYIKMVEYFPIFTIDKNKNKKILKSIMMKVKKRHFKFKEISSREIELSGINILEFNDFLERHGAKEVFNYEQQLENL